MTYHTHNNFEHPPYSTPAGLDEKKALDRCFFSAESIVRVAYLYSWSKRHVLLETSGQLVLLDRNPDDDHCPGNRSLLVGSLELGTTGLFIQGVQAERKT